MGSCYIPRMLLSSLIVRKNGIGMGSEGRIEINFLKMKKKIDPPR